MGFFAKLVNAQGPILFSEEVVAVNINNGTFTAVVKDVAKTVSPVLKACNTVIKLIFGTGNSTTEFPERKNIRNLSESINRFDQVNSQFSNVKNLID